MALSSRPPPFIRTRPMAGRSISAGSGVVERNVAGVREAQGRRM
jgi:hypothetical protein